MKNLSDTIEKYRNYMREIKYRTEVIGRILDHLERDQTMTGYRATDIELIYLQFRHCLELLMFASVVAHSTHGHKLSRRIVAKEYNASRMLRFIKAKNKNFYPVPMKPGEKKDKNGVWKPEKLEDGFLTEMEFCTLYDKTCGKMLHAHRTEKFDKRYQDFVVEAQDYHTKLVSLLNVHWIPVTEDNIFRVVMRDVSNGDVGINYLETIKKDGSNPLSS